MHSAILIAINAEALSFFLYKSFGAVEGAGFVVPFNII